MKKFLVMMAISVLVVPVAFAQPADPDPNGVGVYFDLDGTIYCQETFAGGGIVFNAYVLITNPTATDVTAFEAHCSVETDITFAFGGDWGLASGGTNVGIVEDGEFYAAWNTPIPITGPTVQVASWGGFTSGGTYARFYIQPVTHVAQSVPGECVYVQSSAPGTKIVLQPPTGDWEVPVAYVGEACGVVAGEQKSWGEVKSLF
jgi:hypothetical protein